MKTDLQNSIFDYRTLRLTMGFIALFLPWLVSLFAGEKLISVSHSYYSPARDVFVGMMAIVAAFLFAYNGHSIKQACFSKLAGIAALLVSLFPTACIVCQMNVAAYVHNISAVTLFSVLAYFCIGPFRSKLLNKSGKPALRSRIYLVCGIVMILSIASIVVFPEAILEEYEIIFWAEAIALSAFGFAWIVAGKYFSVFVDKEEQLNIFEN